MTSHPPHGVSVHTNTAHNLTHQRETRPTPRNPDRDTPNHTKTAPHSLDETTRSPY
jgi:hypothetical protein